MHVTLGQLLCDETGEFSHLFLYISLSKNDMKIYGLQKSAEKH